MNIYLYSNWFGLSWWKTPQYKPHSALIGDKGLRHLIRALPSNQISTVDNPKLSHDIDTPAQLAYAKQKHWID